MEAENSLDVRHLEGLDTLSITTLRSLADVCKYNAVLFDKSIRGFDWLQDHLTSKIRVRDKGQNSKLTKVNMNVQHQ